MEEDVFRPFIYHCWGGGGNECEEKSPALKMFPSKRRQGYAVKWSRGLHHSYTEKMLLMFNQQVTKTT